MSERRRPAIHVGPDADARLAAGVERGGGRTTGPDEAEGIVWIGDPDGLRPLLRPGVAWVQLQSAGVESWLRSGLLDGERVWTSAAGAYAPAVAEHTLALILAGRRRLHEAARAQAWADLAGAPLAGATVAIVGAGGIGEALIPLLAALRARVVAVTRSGRAVAGADESLPADRLDEVWPRADVAVIAAPATAETAHLAGEAELNALPAHAWLVNVARGSLVDTDALVRALAEGRLGGAALDVTDPEPLPEGHPLWTEPRALITPHQANPWEAMMPALADRVAENVARLAAGEPLLGRIETERGY